MKLFRYVRFGEFEIGATHGGLHLAVRQPDGQVATWWGTYEEAEDLHARLGGLLAELRRDA